MGNTITSNMPGDEMELKLNGSIVKEMQRHINLADRSTVGLAKSIDSMKASVEMLLKQFNTHTDSSNASGNEEEDQDSAVLTRRVLDAINSSVSDFEFVMMESLSNLLHCIANIAITETDDFQIKFLVDNYMSSNTETEVNDKRPYVDARLESLHNEIQRLQHMRKLDNDEIRALNTRECTYRKEIDELEKNLKSTKTDLKKMSDKLVAAMKISHTEGLTTLDHTGAVEVMPSKNVMPRDIDQSQNEKLQEELITLSKEFMKKEKEYETSLKEKDDVIEKLKQKVEEQSRNDATHSGMTKRIDQIDKVGDNETVSKEDMIMEINSLKEEPNTIKNHRVQIVLEYCSLHGTNISRDKYRDLYKSLRAEMALHRINLQVQEGRSTSSIVPTPTDKAIFIPLCIYTRGVQEKIQQAMKGITAAPNIAVLLFYYAKDSGLASEVKTLKYIDRLGGIFKFVYGMKDVRDEESNADSFRDLLSFLKTLSATRSTTISR